MLSLTLSISTHTPSSPPPPPPSIHWRPHLPRLTLPVPLSLSLFPWQARDWHLQITRRQWHCVWPLSLISSPPPFCHLITVNPRPAPHCCIFNMPAHPLLTPQSPLLSFSRTILLLQSPAAYSTCLSVQYFGARPSSLYHPARPPSVVSPASIITPSPLVSRLSALLLSVECHSIPHTDQSVSVPPFALHFSVVSLQCLVNMLINTC